MSVVILSLPSGIKSSPMNGNRRKNSLFYWQFYCWFQKDELFSMNSQSKTLARKFIIFQPITAQIHNHFKYIDKISHKLTLYLQYYMHLSLLGGCSQITSTRWFRHLVLEMWTICRFSHRTVSNVNRGKVGGQ